MKVKVIWTCGLLMLFLKGCFNKPVKDQYVEYLDKVEVWKGSCTVLPCKYTPKSTYDKFIWYYNAKYDVKNKDFNGTIVYNSKDGNDVDPLFAGRVQYVGKSDTTWRDCTIVIRNIQKEDEGTYNLRLLGTQKDAQKNDRWMSKDPLTIAVSDIGSTLKIHSPPEIRESETVTLSCSISYYCPYNISFNWIEDVNGIDTTYFRKDTYEVSTTTSLQFQPSWRDHKKNITCVLNRDDGEADNKTVQLNVMYAPKNVNIFSNATIEIIKGVSTTLTCSVESSNPPDYDITWFKDNQRQNSKKGSASQLEVTYPGKYFCQAINKIGETKSNLVEVSVLYAPDKPVIKKYGEPIEGKYIKLECSTEANPPVSLYVWFKDGAECYNRTSNRFTIYNIKEDNSGSYTCLARNNLGEANSDKLDLNVMYAPRYPRVVLKLDRPTIGEDDKIVFVEDKVIFVEGDQVIFQCNVNSSNPEVTNTIWYKNGRSISKKLNEPMKAEDAGSYICEAVNSAGHTKSPNIDVDIHYPPKDVDLWISSKSFKENETIKLKCISKTSNPQSSRHEWYKDGVLFKNTTEDFMVLQLEWTHTGQYSCNALNAIGSGRSSPRPIDVKYAPKNVTLTVIPGDYVTEHMDVTLKCTSRGKPTSIHYEFYLNDVFLSSSDGSFQLKDVQIKNIGKYFCSAENDVGQKRSNVVFLHVSYSPATIGKFASIAGSTFIVLLILIILIVRFRVSIKNAFRRRSVDDKSESSFFVMKKKDEAIIVQPSSRLRNELADNIGHPNPSIHSSTDQLHYSRVNFQASSKLPPSNLSSATADNDITTIYSVVRKVPNTHEYENIASPSEIAREDSQDEIHYSVIANLNKKEKERERDPEVEYAKLKHS